MADRPGFRSVLESGRLLLLDGATGSELQRRGISVSAHDDAGTATLVAWSATAMQDAPEVVRAIHEDYLRAGADIVTANSYNTNRGMLALAGLADQSDAFSRISVELAREARDRMNPEAYVAGSLAPTNRFPDGWDPARVPPVEEITADWTRQAEVLAGAGADLLLIETMSAIFQLLPALEAAQKTGLPTLLGIHATAEGTMTSGESMEELAAALEGRDPDGILLMCRAPEQVSASLPNLRAAYGGPVGAYANIGYTKDPDPKGWQYHTIDVGYFTPARYAAFCATWIDMGAQIIGGCCGTTPEHIAALRPLVKGDRATTVTTNA